MTASYTTNGRFTKQGDNDNPNTWGQILNAQVIQLIDDAIMGVKQIDITGSADYNIATTVVNGGTDDARYAVLELIGTLGADIDLIVPSVNKIYVIRGAWTGAYTVRVIPAGGASGVNVSTGNKAFLYTSGTNIYEISPAALLIANNLSDLADVATARTNLGLKALAIKDTINNAEWNGTDLAIANGGTGASTATDALNNILPTQTGNSGKFITTDGSTASWGAGPDISHIGLHTKVIRTTNQSLGSAACTWQQTTGDDTGSFWNVSAPTRLTVPADGVYTIDGTLGWTGLSNGVSIGVSMRLNGSSANMPRHHINAMGSAYVFNVGCTLSLNAGDYLEIGGSHNVAYTCAAGYGYFSMTRIA